MGLSDYLPHLQLKHIPGPESTKLMLLQLREFEKMQNIQKKIGEKINFFLESRNNWSKKSTENGKNYIVSIGGNGAESAATEIVRLIESKKLK